MTEQIKLDTFLEEEVSIEEKGPYKLPQRWKWVKLTDAVTSIGGGTPSKRNSDYWNGSIPWVSPKDVQSFEIYDTQDHITEKGLRESSTSLVKPNSVLVVFRSGILRRRVPIAINRVPVAINQDLKALIPNESLIPEFLAYYLRSTESRIRMNCVKKGATVHRIISNRFSNLEIPLPILGEQKKIVARVEELVGKAEEARDLRKMARQETEKIMQAALHKVFSRAEEEGWEWVRLKDVAKVVGGHTPNRNVQKYWSGDIPWLTPTELPSDIITIISDSKEKITQKGLKNSSAVLIPPGSVLYTSRATIGKIAIAGASLTTNQGFTNFICTGHLYNRYLAYCLKWLTPQIQEESGRTTFREVKRSRLRVFKIPLPPLEEQRKLVAYLDNVSKTLESLKNLQQKTEEELEKLVPAILDRAFKGKW